MTGRDGGAPLAPRDPSPIVVLVRPQLAENIGAAARAMANGGLFHLRLVAPRDGWPQERAFRTASGADRILEEAQLFPDLDQAIADCTRVFATCPRPRHVIMPVLTARGAAAEAVVAGAGGARVAVLFGPERAGLTAEEVARADALIRYPVNPDFPSLNLAQAVMVFAYEWWQAREGMAAEERPRRLVTHETRPATKGEIENFLTHLIAALDRVGFWRTPEKRPGMIRNLRHFFTRSAVTLQELRTLHGIVTELEAGPRRKKEG